ncbi:MAG: hypothetical protein Q4B95_04860, partial [Lonepinella koalarum]|nr:hypothetical protein [Lonepinella koalarum]
MNLRKLFSLKLIVALTTGTMFPLSASATDYVNINENGGNYYGSNKTPETSGALGNRSIAIGPDTKVGNTSPEAIAVGSSATVGSNSADAIAIGKDAHSYGKGAVAIGHGAKSSHENSIALGQNSITEEAVSTPSMVINGKTYNFAGGQASGTLSIGGKPIQSNPPPPIVEFPPIDRPIIVDWPYLDGYRGLASPSVEPTLEVYSEVDNMPSNPNAPIGNNQELEKRTITNVAAGRISETSTDAINGS